MYFKKFIIFWFNFDSKKFKVVRITDRETKSIEQQQLTRKLSDSLQQQKFDSINYSFNATLDISAGLGLSLINKSAEELIYFCLRGVRFHVLKQNFTYQFNGHIDVIQVIFI